MEVGTIPFLEMIFVLIDIIGAAVNHLPRSLPPQQYPEIPAPGV